MNFRWLAFLVAAGVFASSIFFKPALAEEDDGFSAVAAPFLKRHCVRCHGPKEPEAQLMLHKMSRALSPADVQVWEAVLDQLQQGKMPPEDEPQPSKADIAQVVAVIRPALQAAPPALSPYELADPSHGNHVPHELLFQAKPDAAPATPPRIWRVRPSIYESFVEHASREPFHHPFKRESLFSTPWGLEGDGFQDYAAQYWIGEAETELLISNAMRVATIMSRKRSTYADESRVFREFLRTQGKATNEETALLIDTAFGQILQREPTEAEAKRYGDFLASNVEQLGREKGMQTTLAALLLHPKAVFRFELGLGESEADGRVRLAPSELAYAIAYAVTDRAPDDQLRKAASDGELSTQAGIQKQVLRLIDAEQARMQQSYRSNKIGPRHTRPALLRFFQEYFGYTSAPQIFKDQAIRREARLSGNYSPEALVSDTNLLVLHLIDKDEQVLRELLTTDLSFVSTGRGRWNGLTLLKERAKQSGRSGRITPFDDKRNRINEHYNVSPDEWTEQMPFPLDKSQRAGVLTQPSWLIAHSTNFENHAIHRGKWVRERLLGGTIPDTPITVDAQLPDDKSLTLRERMHVTREAFCWKCHQQMDPLGLPFENYDHFGRFRTKELGEPVDASGEITLSGDAEIDGPVDGAVELMHRLAASRRVQQVFVRHAFRFFMGRNETPSDAATLIAADRAYTESGGSIKTLVAVLISSDSFVYRRPHEDSASHRKTD